VIVCCPLESVLVVNGVEPRITLSMVTIAPEGELATARVPAVNWGTSFNAVTPAGKQATAKIRIIVKRE
jgi:hypothetical protein